MAPVLCLLLIAAVVVIDGKAMKTKRQYEDEMPDLECMMRLFSCAAPVMSLTEETIREAVEVAGIRGACGLFQPIADCLETELGVCGDQFPPEVKQPLGMTTDVVNFICRDEIDSIIADQDCLFSDELEAASKKCEAAPSGEVCNLVEDTECALEVYEETCDNQNLANKFRALVGKLESDSGCHKAKVRSMNWLKAFKILRRR